ncbi:MAG: TonB-dependent receptor [Bacteroidales bacterium]|nr:TonB-dependent receptor [Bacteroidales bacterium]
MKSIIRNLLMVSVFLMGGAAYALAQPTLKGKVTDTDGLPLPGVAVMVPGTTNGTMTDDNGDYSLSGLKKGDVILFTSLGMGDQTFECTGSLTKLDVVMAEDATFIEETIVVGYGVQKKSSMTSAVSAMKGDELLKAPATNVSQLLAGKLTGVSSVQESGEPGLDQAAIRIRGSQGAAKYVVDGFPVDDINDIDPYDIESISVLKDGASAAVYGLQAANGIIIITTKKGTSGKPKITYNATFGASMNANFPEFMDGPQFAYYYNVADMMDKLSSGAISSESEYVPVYTKEQVEMMTNGDPTDGWDNVNYIDKVFGTGFTQKHNVTVQGGNEKSKYFASFGFLGQDGNIDNFSYNRYNIRTNIESQLAKNFKFSMGLSGVFSNRQTPAYAAGGTDANSYLGETGWLSIASQTIIMHPYLPETYNGMYTATLKKNTSLPQSPLAAIYDSGYKKERGIDVSANMSLTYDIPGVKGLQLKVAGAFDYGATMNKNLNTPYSVMAYTGGEWVEKADPRGTGNGVNLGEGTSYYQRMTGQAGVTYTNTFGKHFVDLLALAELNDYKTNAHSAYAKLLPFASLPELSYGQPTDSPISGSSDAFRSAGYVFRARYNWDERYLVEFTGRYDGSYKFAGMRETRWGFFPSASAAWNLSKEPWMSQFNALDDLKIRGSVALLGNDAGTNPYMFANNYSKYDYQVIYADGSVNPAYKDAGIANVDLTWEKSLSYNVGFDLSLWNGKLAMEVDGFYNYVFDILTAQSSGYPSSMGGYYMAFINHNAYDTKGIDVMLSHRNSFMLGGKPFQYGISGTVTYARSRWIIYQDEPNTPDNQKVVGTPLGAIMAWTADGLYRSEEEIDNSAWYGTRPNVGDIKYVDINGDGKIDWSDRGKVGRTNRPELTYGLNLDFAWNGIDFNAQFTGGALFDVSLTGTYYNYMDDNTVWTQTFKEGANSPLFLVENAYSIYNTDGTFPRMTLGTPGHGGDNGLASTFWLRDGTYVRLKTAQLGYTFPHKWTGRINVEALRLFVEGQNLFTIDGLPEGIDPESPGVNNGYYPQQRLIMGGITITF